VVYKLSEASQQVAYQARGNRIIAVNGKNQSMEQGISAEFDEASVETEIIEYE